MISVEVVYASEDRQLVIPARVSAGASVKEAIEVSGILEQMPEIDLQSQAVGIFGKRVKLNQVIQQGDRIEIYRPLRISPTEARRLRARSK